MLRSGELHSPRATEATARPTPDPGRDRCRLASTGVVCLGMVEERRQKSEERVVEGAGQRAHPRVGVHTCLRLDGQQWSTCRHGERAFSRMTAARFGRCWVESALGAELHSEGDGHVLMEVSWPICGWRAVSCREMDECRWRLCSHSRIAKPAVLDARHRKAAICWCAPNGRAGWSALAGQWWC